MIRRINYLPFESTGFLVDLVFLIRFVVLCYFVLFVFDLRPVPNVTGASGLSILGCSFGVLIFMKILNLVNTEKLSH